jgi:enamine deaminase RidA (YjgF/YER057c/UK114 family)
MATDSTTAEDRLARLGIKLPAPPEPFGTYAEAVQTGNLLFLTGMLPTEGEVRNSSGGSALSSMWKRGAMRLTWRR